MKTTQPVSPSKALVLSGGSIKGAFQAGAIAEVLKAGFIPDAIYGISVGALNGAFLTDRAGRAALQGKHPDWPAIGEELVEFWQREIRSASDIARKRGFFRLLWSLITHKWDGLTDTSPLRKLVARELRRHHIANSPVHYACGATNLHTGKIFYADAQNSGERLLDYVIASTAIPFFMPQVVIRRSTAIGTRESAYVDGAGRDSSPLGIAIDRGATHVLGIYCHPDQLDIKPQLQHRRIGTYIERVMDIISNEQIANDHKLGLQINELLKLGAANHQGPLAGKRVIKGLAHVVRPERELDFQIDHICPQDINTMIALGRQSAKHYLIKVAQDPDENPMAPPVIGVA